MIGRNVIFVVLDGVGIGELPDAPSYGDRGANTIGNIARTLGGLHLPHLERLGLGRITPVKGLDPRNPVEGCFGKMAERSKGKDSTTGHWEIAGIITERAFPLYPKGFPTDVIERFLHATGCKGILGNMPASGTEIIKKLGEEHVRTGYPIVYTSGDSVFQIAAHEEVIPLESLYRICLATRQTVMVGEHAVGRVIARPFVGQGGDFRRTPNRRDFSLEPPSDTVLDLLTREGFETVGIGKVVDLFAGRGFSRTIHTKSNSEGVGAIVREGRMMSSGFIMANLVDFDMLYGHRQDPEGFGRALEEFDKLLPEILAVLKGEDMLILTADHGNDPTDSNTDHSREYVPLLISSPSGSKGVDLGTRQTFADAGKTVADIFHVANSLSGTSFLSMMQQTARGMS
ncbi:MAG: phosphopentomutase [Bacteroidota bacterium]